MSEDEDYVPESTLGLDPVEFVERYPHTVVRVEIPQERSGTGEFVTMAGPRPERLASLGTQVEVERLIRVRKRDGNPFALMITIGRAQNNDIHLHSKDVSKFHAYLTEGEEGWRITDAGSTNGTFLNGVQLSKGVSVALELEAPLILGSTQVTLLQGRSLYDYLLQSRG